MDVPLQVAFRHMAHSARLETQARGLIARLERFQRHVINAHLTLDAQGAYRCGADVFKVRLNVRVPGGEIVVTQQAPLDPERDDIDALLDDAFHLAERRLTERVASRSSVHAAQPSQAL